MRKPKSKKSEARGGSCAPAPWLAEIESSRLKFLDALHDCPLELSPDHFIQFCEVCAHANDFVKELRRLSANDKLTDPEAKPY